MRHWPSFGLLWKLVLGYLVLSSLYLISCTTLSAGFEQRPGTGQERPAAYRAAMITNEDLLLTFTIARSANPGQHNPVTDSHRDGWARLPLSALEWYGPDYAEHFARVKQAPNRPTPVLSSDMAELDANRTESGSMPIREFRDGSLQMKAEGYRSIRVSDHGVIADIPEQGESERFERDVVARCPETCLLRDGDQLTLIRRSRLDSQPQFAFLAAPQRRYERWWATPLYVATYPARAVLVAGSAVLIAIFGMH